MAIQRIIKPDVSGSTRVEYGVFNTDMSFTFKSDFSKITNFSLSVYNFTGSFFPLMGIEASEWPINGGNITLFLVTGMPQPTPTDFAYKIEGE